MSAHIVGYIQLIFMLLLCAIVGTPQTAFSSIEHFMLNEHIYEDRCKVLFALENNVYCDESREAYTNVYDMAGLAYALAVVPAIYSSTYLGFSVTNLLSSISLAAGSMVITSHPEDQWLTDRMAYGYAFVSFSGPFAVMNALNIISTLTKNKSLLVFLLLVLFATLQLSPLIWTVFSWQFANIDLAVSDLFNGLLWVPTFSIALTLAWMPLTAAPQELNLSEFVRTLKSSFFFAVSKTFQAGTDYATPSYWDMPLVPLLLAYTCNSMAMDLMYLGGEPKAFFHKELEVWVELTLWSPCIAAVATLLILGLNMRRGVCQGLKAGYLLSILITLGQFWSIRKSWLLASLFSGVAQATLIFSTTISLFKSIPTDQCGPVAAGFLIVSSLLKLWILPPLEAATEFDTRPFGHNAYLELLCAQVIFSGYAILRMRNESFKERRALLEAEAENAIIIYV